FEELNKNPLPGRENIVLSKSKSYDHVKTFSDIETALEYVRNQDKVFIIGGGEIYRQTIDLADALIITQIKNKYEGDTYFPEYRNQISSTWKQVWKEEHEEFSFVKYEKSVD
ncbi:MAG: dihydrofolate reductase, partial [Balneolaceae bacterium]